LINKNPINNKHSNIIANIKEPEKYFPK